MVPAAVEFTDYLNFPKQPLEGKVNGISQRVIRRDAQGRCVARIIEYGPGVDTTPNGVQCHDYYEEILILKGSMTDLTLHQTFSSGYVASRPPGMPHGPWSSEEGCIMYEVDRYLD